MMIDTNQRASRAVFSFHDLIYSILLLIFTLKFFVFCNQLQALDVPTLKGRVNDYAAMLSPLTTQNLDSVLAEFESTDSTQIVVLTITSLEGESLEEYSIRVAETWEIGQEGHDNGALLLIAKADRQLRIEVGYGLEGRLTDATAGRIIRSVIIPALKTGHYDQAITNGVAAMIQAVRGEFEGTDSDQKEPSRSAGGLTPIFLFIFFSILTSQLGRISRLVGMLAGGILAPIFGVAAFSMAWPYFLLLIPIGFIFGYFISGFIHGTSGGGNYSQPSRGRWHGGGFGGGFGGGGGFSGGGGGFGGGGASGSW
jgi:uncharacterized protein